ncbi:Neuronal PAS domain-containing protein 3 [Acropora cervicornis]|uniref:Neuronal PAS domain-containing protein 3 n=1 Tax=Acropora cervicornis TaxID=6130 RepID=A0AAD9QHW2_ACRCE|nr:Neuronal PAS domain-containing protein 3 [Acropora cervicornis]
MEVEQFVFVIETGAVEQRKERSRDAARSRRGKENAQFDELAKLLPLPSAITSQLDKASIVRLTISYLNMRQFNIHKQSRGHRLRSSGSFPSETSTSPPSDTDVDILFTSSGISSPNSPATSPTIVPGPSSGSVVPYNPGDITLQDLAANSGIFLLQALDGFLLVLSSEGKVLYVSETVSNHLGLSQVELTGSNISNYIHHEDHTDLFGMLESAREEVEHPNDQPGSRAYTDNIPFFGGEQPFNNSDDVPDKEKPKSFFMRMKCTLVRRGGSYTKSSGFKVIHCMGRMRRYQAKGIPEAKYAFVTIGQPLPTMNINELPLECDMFVSRVNMDLKIVYCEGRIHKFMDYFARDIVGISAYDFYHANDVTAIQGHHAKFLSKGQVLTKYYRWMNKNGGWVWMQTKASLIPHPTNPDLKQMLCLNYIVSEVEHRGVVLGMTQLEDKPQLESRSYITEVENEADDTGELKDAQYDEEVMVYPKWHENSDKLLPKPTVMDTLALSRTGYPKTTDIGPPMTDEVFTTMADSLTKVSAVTSLSKRYSAKANEGSASTLDEDFEDLEEILGNLNKIDCEIVNFVANGTDTSSSTAAPLPEASLDNMLRGNWMGGVSSNGAVLSGTMLGAPKMELDESMNFNEQTSQAIGIPSQPIGNLPVGSYPDDVKPGLISLDGEPMFQVPNSKRRAVNNPCMFNNASSTVVRNVQPNGSQQRYVSSSSNVPVAGSLQELPGTGSTNNLGTSVVSVRIPAYVSNQPVNVIERRGPVEGSVMDSTTSMGSQTMDAKESQLQFAQLLKEVLPDSISYSDEYVVDLVDEMMIDREDQSQRIENDQRLASLLQQGNLVQPDVFIKQEVVTPTMAQQTFAYPTVSNSVARQQCQPPLPSSSFTSTSNANGDEGMFVGSPHGSQNGTVTNHGSLGNFQNGNVQFSSQEDSNMNFLNSLSNLTRLPGNASWNSNLLPKQNAQQQDLRTFVQNANNVSTPVQSPASGLLPSRYSMVPQNGSRLPHGNALDVNISRNMSELDCLLQTGQLPTSSYQNINGAGLLLNNQTFVNMNRKL